MAASEGCKSGVKECTEWVNWVTVHRVSLSFLALSFLPLCSPSILSSSSLFTISFFFLSVFFLSGQKTGMTLVHHVFVFHAWRQRSDTEACRLRKSCCDKRHVYVMDPPLDHGDVIHLLFEYTQMAYEDKSLTGPKMWTRLGSCYKWTTGRRSTAILEEAHNTPKLGVTFFFVVVVVSHSSL